MKLASASHTPMRPTTTTTRSTSPYPRPFAVAGSLLRRNFPVTVLARATRPRVRLEDLIAAGAAEAPTPALVAKQSDVMLLCVTGAPEVEETVFGPSGIIEGARPGLFVVDATTSEVSSSTKTREALAKRGIIFVDAPLTRTPAAAELGKVRALSETEGAVNPDLTDDCAPNAGQHDGWRDPCRF